MPSQFLIDFEQRLDVGATQVARVLGIGYSTYAAYRSQSRALPLYHAKHIHHLLANTRATIAILIEKDINGH